MLVTIGAYRANRKCVWPSLVLQLKYFGVNTSKTENFSFTKRTLNKTPVLNTSTCKRTPAKRQKAKKELQRSVIIKFTRRLVPVLFSKLSN